MSLAMKKYYLIMSLAGSILSMVHMASATGMIESLSKKIVSRGDTNDEKMYKIEQWVQKNIAYVSDIKLYGREDASYFPAVTIRKRKADCEDGSFLMQALAAYAGVPIDRVRTLFGKFHTPEGTKGHAWTVYRREIDNQWVVMDWTDKRVKAPVSERVPMPRDPFYKRLEIFAFTIITKMRPLRATFIRGKF
jgi:predicted transglutaminase-like cysteine proteinase